MIVGIDEVGRGAWAGPLAVGAVLLGGAVIDGLTDSKKLTKKQRTILDLEIRQKALGVGIGWVSARHIDRIGLSAALKLAANQAIKHIRHEHSEIIIDGTIRLIDDPRVTLMKKADLLIPSVSAASIIAKVARDNYMRRVDALFPGYRFSTHVGYGTAAHRSAIQQFGVTPLHRVSFMPLRKYAQHEEPSKERIGSRAEAEVAAYLERDGHAVLDRNWRTRFCEIDVVSLRGRTVYFTEVKYRRTDAQGGGLAAITAKKQRQMAFAAELYMVKHPALRGYDVRLAAASASGTSPQVLEFLELL